jgi:hypothetical protein
MTPSRWWTLLAVLALAVVGPETHAASKKKTSASSKDAEAGLVRKTYHLTYVHDPAEADLLISFVTRAVEPTSWSGHGGHGKIEAHVNLSSDTLVVHQTPAVHAQISCLLKAVAMYHAESAQRAEQAATAPVYPQPLVQAVYAAPAPPVAPAVYSAPSTCPDAKPTQKQYGHFVMDDIKVNAMGVTTTIKKIRFMYKGDGIEADVAKCALTNGDSERKGDLEKLVEQVSKLVEVKDGKKEKVEETKASSCNSCPPCPASVCGTALPPCSSSPGPVSMPAVPAGLPTCAPCPVTPEMLEELKKSERSCAPAGGTHPVSLEEAEKMKAKGKTEAAPKTKVEKKDKVEECDELCDD